MTDHVFLIAIVSTHEGDRSAARHEVYAALNMMPRGRGGPAIDSWWDATGDGTDRHDNDEAVFVDNGRTREALAALTEKGLTRSHNHRLGEHPGVQAMRNDLGETIIFECERCGEGAESLAALGLVPCRSLSFCDHGHYWTWDGVDLECLSCELKMLVSDEAWEASSWKRYVVLDQNGSILTLTDSWAIAARTARGYGPMASVFDHDTRSLQITGTLPEDGED